MVLAIVAATTGRVHAQVPIRIVEVSGNSGPWNFATLRAGINYR
jgi:hypothetical protein